MRNTFFAKSILDSWENSSSLISFGWRRDKSISHVLLNLHVSETREVFLLGPHSPFHSYLHHSTLQWKFWDDHWKYLQDYMLRNSPGTLFGRLRAHLRLLSGVATGMSLFANVTHQFYWNESYLWKDCSFLKGRVSLAGKSSPFSGTDVMHFCRLANVDSQFWQMASTLCWQIR